MVYYFSGTGNSRRVALSLCKSLGEECRAIPECDPITESVDGESLGIVCPIYAWGIPPIVLEFISRLNMKEVERFKTKRLPVWIVLTYGDEAGDALSMMVKAIGRRGLTLNGAWGIQTPNVYVLLPGFDVDPKDLEQKKLKDMNIRCDSIARKISEHNWELDVYRGSFAKIKTAIVYPIFKHWGVDYKKWRCDLSTCISCGQCERVCPVNNIAMSANPDGRRYPCWGDGCTSCCACYHVCPTNSIGYSSFTKNKGQFQP